MMRLPRLLGGLLGATPGKTSIKRLAARRKSVPLRPSKTRSVTSHHRHTVSIAFSHSLGQKRTLLALGAGESKVTYYSSLR
jgi:hypothetical protein